MLTTTERWPLLAFLLILLLLGLGGMPPLLAAERTREADPPETSLKQMTEPPREEPEELHLRWREVHGRKGTLAPAIQQAMQIPEFAAPHDGSRSSGPFGWKELAPGIHSTGSQPSYSGRVNVARYAKDAVTGDVVLFLGTVGGGLWKAVNLVLFAAWVPVSASLEGSPSVGDFAIHREEPNIMLIGTGEPFRYPGTGLYRSDDAGASWSALGWTGPVEFVTRMAVSSEDPELLLISTIDGIFRTEDFGLTGSFVHAGWTHDVAQDPANPSRWLATQSDVGVLESTDNGLSFAPIGGHGGIGIGDGVGRMELAFAPSQPNYVYAIANGAKRCVRAGQPLDIECDSDEPCLAESRCLVDGDEFTDDYCEEDSTCEFVDGSCALATCQRVGSGELWGVFRSDNGGESWVAIDSVDVISLEQGFHAMAIEVDPSNADRLFVGMGRPQMTENATAENPDTVQWRRSLFVDCQVDEMGNIGLPNTSACDFPVSHADYTDFEFAPPSIDPSGNTMAIANDGGIYVYNRTTDAINVDLNVLGLNTSQAMEPVVSHGGAYEDDKRHYAGLQDNGMIRISKGDSRPLLFRRGGDGGATTVSATDPLRVGFSSGLKFRRFSSSDGLATIQSINCENYCLDSAGNWTDISCFNPDSGQPDDALCDDVGGSCSSVGLDDEAMYSVVANTVSSVYSETLFTHQDKKLLSKPSGASCSWVDIPAGGSLPENYNIRSFDMANNPTGRVFYSWNRAGRVFVLDEIDAGGPGAASWIERTPDKLPGNYDFNGGALTAARHALQPNIVYYATGGGRPSRALISPDRGKPLTWIDVTGNLAADLPNADYWELVSNPRNNNQMFLATSVGVFRTDNGLDANPQWYRYSEGLPAVVNAMTLELNANATANSRPTLTIGTDGRGFWERDVFSAGGGFVPGTPGPNGDGGLQMSHEGGGFVTMSWQPSCATGDGDYVIYEGVLGDFNSHEPIACSTQGSTAYTLEPSQENRYYLIGTVSFANPQGETQGVPGLNSNGDFRSAGQDACYPVEIGECTGD